MESVDSPTERTSRGPQPNQHRPTVPDEVLLPRIEEYWSQGLGDAAIAEAIKLDVGAAERGWGLSKKTVARRRKMLKMASVRQQAHTIESIRPYMEKLVRKYPHAGAKRLKDWLALQQIFVSEHLIREYNLHFHPEDVIGRKGKHLKRKRFWSPGVFATVAVDQHDKWKRFGLYLHLGLETFSGYLLWVEPWWTNRNPRLICSFYIDMARKHQGVPLLTQSNPGSENNGIANAHTTLRQLLDPSLVGMLQHRWMRGHANIKPKIKWSQLRREFTTAYENLFDLGVIKGWYDRWNQLQYYTFRWIAIPFLRENLREYIRMHNTSKPRADKTKVLPLGRPEHILFHPERFGNARDFKVLVTDQELSYVEDLYAPRHHAVFRLVPDKFEIQIIPVYIALGCPETTMDNFWDIYHGLLDGLRNRPDHAELLHTLASEAEREETIDNEYMDLLEGSELLEESDMYESTSEEEAMQEGDNGGVMREVEELDVSL
ncbi:hypothetical protein CALCODRAFT_492445 [Calocera cornea HHB12733]|uniref:Integrase core domain-containing protein n=1 Tax=Calocera cornea HHB12733 TaxID=1353952 RepID=A0A165ICJ6_9BASI|nr:hypothetical protein CALCODRAFT_492445 [Calocera cornea HHB12733]